MKYSFFMVFSLLLVGCGKNSSSGSAPKLQGFRSAIYGTFDFNADYVAKCQKVSIDGTDIFVVSSMKIRGARPDRLQNSSIVVEMGYTLDSECNNGFLQAYESGTFELENEATELHLKASTAWLMPLTQQLASEYRIEKLCGLTDWKANSSTNVLNTSCYSQNNTSVFFINSLDPKDERIQVKSCPNNSLEDPDCVSLEYNQI